WNDYLSQTEKIDKALVEDWKGDADTILIFTGLFSATVGTFALESYKSLRPDPSVDLLSKLVAFTIDGTHLSTSPAPQAFHASPNSVWVSALWFCSLVLSIACALGATLVQQWVRVYTQVTQDAKPSTLERGRVRALMFNGVIRFHMPQIIRGMPLLLHTALFI
ncbi:hypothetical protein OF83DRAFT_1031245, partial [Amylostereum chailletii]